MKIYNGGKIFFGLIIFIGLVTSPFLLNIGKSNIVRDPKAAEIMQLMGLQCVEKKTFMRANHMQLLDEWRDSVVRKGNSLYKASDGKNYVMSLQNTCMNCHSEKNETCNACHNNIAIKHTCDGCHNSIAVKPYCWDCHIAPKEKKS